MEELTKFIPIVSVIIGSLGGVKMLTLIFARWDKWQEKRAKARAALKEESALHLSESVERQKLALEHDKTDIDFLRGERTFYKAEAEKWREKHETDVERWKSIASKAVADVVETLQIVQKTQERHSQEIEESREREKRCLENVQRLEKEIEALKSRVKEIE